MGGCFQKFVNCEAQILENFAFLIFTGFHKVLTMLRFTVDTGKIDNLEVIQVDR